MAAKKNTASIVNPPNEFLDMVYSKTDEVAGRFLSGYQIGIVNSYSNPSQYSCYVVVRFKESANSNQDFDLGFDVTEGQNEIDVENAVLSAWNMIQASVPMRIVSTEPTNAPPTQYTPPE